MILVMSNYTVYIFHFSNTGDVIRLAYRRWCHIRAGDESVKEYSNKTIHIAYTYLTLENKKLDFCPRIDGAIYYFDKDGSVILDKPHYFDLLQDMDEDAGAVINLQHRKKKKEITDKYYWKLNPQQIQRVIECIW